MRPAPRTSSDGPGNRGFAPLRNRLRWRDFQLFFDNSKPTCAREIGRLAKSCYRPVVAQSEERAAVAPPPEAGRGLKHAAERSCKTRSCRPAPGGGARIETCLMPMHCRRSRVAPPPEAGRGLKPRSASEQSPRPEAGRGLKLIPLTVAPPPEAGRGLKHARCRRTRGRPIQASS